MLKPRSMENRLWCTAQSIYEYDQFLITYNIGVPGNTFHYHNLSETQFSYLVSKFSKIKYIDELTKQNFTRKK